MLTTRYWRRGPTTVARVVVMSDEASANIVPSFKFCPAALPLPLDSRCRNLYAVMCEES